MKILFSGLGPDADLQRLQERMAYFGPVLGIQAVRDGDPYRPWFIIELDIAPDVATEVARRIDGIDNCTTGIWVNARVNPGHVPLPWKILASGYLPEYLHDIGMLASGLPFAGLQRLGYANLRARATDDSEDFSRLIRVGLPGQSAGAHADEVSPQFAIIESKGAR